MKTVTRERQGQKGNLFQFILTQPKDGEAPKLSGITIAATYAECVEERGEPLSIDESANGLRVTEWSRGKFKVSGEFWLEAGEVEAKCG